MSALGSRALDAPPCGLADPSQGARGYRAGWCDFFFSWNSHGANTVCVHGEAGDPHVYLKTRFRWAPSWARAGRRDRGTVFVERDERSATWCYGRRYWLWWSAHTRYASPRPPRKHHGAEPPPWKSSRRSRGSSDSRCRPAVKGPRSRLCPRCRRSTMARSCSFRAASASRWQRPPTQYTPVGFGFCVQELRADPERVYNALVDFGQYDEQILDGALGDAMSRRMRRRSTSRRILSASASSSAGCASS